MPNKTPDSDRYETRNHLIVGGKEWPCRSRTILWTDSGLEFKAGDGGRRRHPKIRIDLLCLHWTGSENSIQQLYRTLDSRELGVEFAIDREGIVWQFCDPMTVDTFDAGYVNARSVGVEIVNYGFVAHGREPPGDWMQTRGVYECELRGKRRAFARFLLPQLGAALSLADTLTAAIPTITRRVPTEDGHLITETMTPREVQNYSGLIGHYHVSEAKSDPGTEIFDHLMANGYGVARESGR
jgi:hypothetical protein